MTHATDTHAQGWTDVMGPRVQFVTPVREEEGYCVMRALFPSGVVIPIHSHPDHETLFVLTGEIEGRLDGTWQTYRAGQILDILADQAHALRNASGKDAELVLVTTIRLGRFLRDIGQPVDPGQGAVPSPDRLAALVALSHRYGYRLGTPEDNAEAGLIL